MKIDKIKPISTSKSPLVAKDLHRLLKEVIALRVKAQALEIGQEAESGDGRTLNSKVKSKAH